MHKATVGNVEVTALLDCPILMNPDYFLPAHAETLRADYRDSVDERGLLPMAITCFLLRSAGKNILVDTGIGARKRAGFPIGHLDERLRETGITPDEIDIVIATHLHIDHVGWNTVERESGREVFFPRATFLFQQREWDHWMRPEHVEQPANAHLVECVEPVMAEGQVQLVEANHQLDEHLTFIAAPGHTPGHVAVGIMSAGEKAVIVGDASHHPVQLNHPDWSPSADTDPVLSARTRDALFDRAIAEERLWLAGHWEHPGIGRLKRVEGRRVFAAL